MLPGPFNASLGRFNAPLALGCRSPWAPFKALQPPPDHPQSHTPVL